MSDQVKYTQKLKGAKVLVIGGSSGIGFCVAEALTENGAHVIVSSSNQTRVEQAVARLQKAYPSASSRVSGHACNLGEEASLESNVVNLLEKAGKVDHIVHTAGDAFPLTPLADMDFSQMKHAGMVRFFAPLFVAKHAPKYLTGGPNSSITLTSGTVGERPVPNRSAITGFAAGLQGMTRALALDLKPIRVNLVSPGAVSTELWHGFGMSEEQLKHVYEGIAKNNPTGKVGTPEELAEAYLYVIKDTNITGTMIASNSGALLIGATG